MRDKIVLIHIPKTAGSSLRAVLVDAIGHKHSDAGQLIGVNEPLPGMPYFEGLTSAARPRLPELFKDGLRVMSGHYRYRDIAPVLGRHRNHVSLITFLRDPIRRTLSDYFYSSSDRHPGRDEFRKTFPTFEDYTRNTGEMNKQTDYLRPFDDAPLDITIENALHNIDFIGLTEQFESDCQHLLDALQTSSEVKRSVNVAQNKDRAQRAYDQYHDMLQEVLADDIALYDAVSNRRRFPK